MFPSITKHVAPCSTELGKTNTLLSVHVTLWKTGISSCNTELYFATASRATFFPRKPMLLRVLRVFFTRYSLHLRFNCCYNVDILTTFGLCVGGVWWKVGETAPPLVLWVLADSVSGVVLGVGRLTIAWVTVRVLFDLLFELSTAFKLDLEDLFIVGNLIWMSFNSSWISWRFLDFWNENNYILHVNLLNTG